MEISSSITEVGARICTLTSGNKKVLEYRRTQVTRKIAS